MALKKIHIHPIPKWMLVFLASVLMFVFYYFVYTEILGFKTPRRIRLEERNQRLLTQKELLQSRMADVSQTLSQLKERDQNVYRAIFGMPMRPFTATDTTHSPFSTINCLYTMAYEQSVSYDTIAPIAENITKMTSCVPSIPPVNPRKIMLTSHFGVRSDPMAGSARVHMGVDLAGPSGLPVYAAGDGRVAEANINFHGYGNEVIIDHGFGYKTRYAHLKQYMVHEGQYVKRGEQIGILGTSGKSTGSHLHYEVLYMGNRVNPVNFFDLKISDEEYKRLVETK